jgi:hypothetical protein
MFAFSSHSATGLFSPASLLLLIGLFAMRIENSHAFGVSTPSVALSQPSTMTLFFQNDQSSADSSISLAERQRREWVDRSMDYYSRVMRQERRRNLGQVKDYETAASYQREFTLHAQKHYFALRKIKDGKPAHAEQIYRRIIGEIQSDTGHHCDHAQLAVTTLLLALHLQRTGAPPKHTRSVFLHFVRVAIVEEEEDECACSAKVLQAFALFEMKQGHALKSLQLVQKAIELDATLQPVLQWKQFREASARSHQQQQRQQQLQ